MEVYSRDLSYVLSGILRIMKRFPAVIAFSLVLAGASALPSMASADPIPLTNVPTVQCTGITAMNEIGSEGDASMGITVTYGLDHTFSGFTGPGDSYSLQHQQYILNNGSGRTILNAKGVLANFGAFRATAAAVPRPFVLYYRWDNTLLQYIADSQVPYYQATPDGSDTTHPGFSTYAVQAGAASALSYETVASNGVKQEPDDSQILLPTDTLPTYALGTVAPDGLSTADFMLAIENAPNGNNTSWGTDLHFSGQFQCPVITGSYSATASLTSAYSSTVTTTAEGAVTYSLGSGALPAGLSLDSATGAITGTPTVHGVFEFVVYATDAWGEFTSTSTTLTIADPATASVALAATGFDGSLPLVVGGVMLLGGVAAIAVGRRRRTA